MRGFVAFTLIVQAIAYVQSRELSALSWLITAVAFLTAVCLLIGFLTPIVAVVIGVGAIALATFDFQFATGSLIRLAVVASAIALLGPGAFSLDSRLFGRREILIRSGM
ncbi:MAG TPA: hypothetical protein VFR12_05725 [Pyrinomonadaceae bacterium]|nr:hypothetical protein [Pyrinomonadaceae bacterium]